VCKAPPTTSESGKNASDQETFGSKAKEMLVQQSPAVLTANVTNAVVGTRATAASAAEKAGASTAPPTGRGGGARRPLHGRPAPTSDPQTVEAGGARGEDDMHWCLYVGTPWEEEVITDSRDVNKFKEASHTIRHVLSVRILVWVLKILSLSRGILHGLISSFVCSCCSHLLIGRRLG
jgi:hypothetical protein